jgi:hypothetical protein
MFVEKRMWRTHATQRFGGEQGFAKGVRRERFNPWVSFLLVVLFF